MSIVWKPRGFDLSMLKRKRSGNAKTRGSIDIGRDCIKNDRKIAQCQGSKWVHKVQQNLSPKCKWPSSLNLSMEHCPINYFGRKK